MARPILVAVSLAAAALTLPAAAQTMMDTSTLNLGMTQMQENSFLFQSINSTNAGIDASSRAARSQPRTRRSGPQPDIPNYTAPLAKPGVTWGVSATTFRSVAPSIMPHVFAVQYGNDAKHRAVLEKYYAATLADYRDLARKRGAVENDVSRAAAFFIATCYDVLQGRDTLTAADMIVLRAQMQGVFAQNAKFQGLDDRRRQEMFEKFAILGMHIGGLQERGRVEKDPKIAALARDMSRDLLESTFGLPASRVRIDGRGLRFL